MPELLRESSGGEIYPVHRLDRAVGGLMVYAKRKDAAGALSGLIASGRLEKRYLACASGCPEEKEGIYRDLLFKDSGKNKSYVVKRMRKGVKEAELSYRLLGRRDDKCLLLIQLKTGRSHQIRVQLASRKMPLLGDVKYGSQVRACGIALWSYELCFKHPFTGENMKISALPPEEYPWRDFKEADL